MDSVIPLNCLAGCGGIWEPDRRWPRLVEYHGPVEFKTIGALDTPERLGLKPGPGSEKAPPG